MIALFTMKTLFSWIIAIFPKGNKSTTCMNPPKYYFILTLSYLYKSPCLGRSIVKGLQFRNSQTLNMTKVKSPSKEYMIYKKCGAY